MRVWDVHPGYLNRQSLLGEHREIHGLLSILEHGKTGYSRHPETLRWKGHLWAARRRHDHLVEEMTLRGYRHHSPVVHRGRRGRWPETFVDTPAEQFRILARKYVDREPGRIPLPTRTQQLWAQHKYSVLARDPTLYREIGLHVAPLKGRAGFDELASELVDLLRRQPTRGRLRNAVEHMWGYVADGGAAPEVLGELFEETQTRVVDREVTYLLHSTALSDLAAWNVDGPRSE